MTKHLIPIMHCFDNNYALPASVAFYSLLEHANPNYDYKLYVLHSDITKENQEKLQQTISVFKNACLEFINMENKFDDLFSEIKNKGHYSKEMFYKFLPSNIFQNYDKMIISDVDVVYLGDIAPSYFSFHPNEDVYFAGVKSAYLKGSQIETCFKNAYKDKFSSQEIETLDICGGYYVFNLKKMRENNMTQKLIEYCTQNIHRILQPEQDCISLCCYPQIRYLPVNNLICSYIYDLYQKEKDFEHDVNYNKEQLKDGYENPIQLHYTTQIKPWGNSSCTKAEEWFKVLVKTPYLKEWLTEKQEDSKSPPKKLFSLSLPVLANRKISFEITKTKMQPKEVPSE